MNRPSNMKLLVAAAALAAASACSNGDDDGPDPDTGTDTGADVTEDTEADVTDDVAEDANDGGSDTEPDAAEDVADATADISEDADTGADVGDQQPPTLRDVRFDFDGSLGGSGDLNSDDVRVAIPRALDVTFTVFAIDDLAATEDLVVRVVDTEADDAVIEPVSAELASGLWNVGVVVSAGSSLVVEVEDEAGNVARSEGALVLPSVADVIVGDWVGRTFLEDQSALEVRNWSFAADGTFTVDNPDGTGDYAVEGFTIDVIQRTGDDATTEWRRSDAYVDELYVDFDPLNFMGDADPTSDLVGTWTTSAEYLSDPGGDVVASETTTVVFEDDGDWSLFTDRTGDGAMRLTEVGTFRIELNENYSESFGDFIVWETTARNGSAITPETHVDQWRLRGGQLLIAPLLPAE